MRFLAVAALPLVLLSVGEVRAAADCANTSLASGNTGSILFDAGAGYIVAAGESATCSLVNAAYVPAGSFGVFKVDSRGFAGLETGKTAMFTLDSNGVLQGFDVNGEYSDEIAFTRYVSTGLVASDTPFAADVTLAVDAPPDALSWAQYDSLDLLVGYTSLASVQASIDEVAAGRTAIANRLDAAAALLTGGNQPLLGADEVGLIGGVGSAMFGVAGRHALGDGLSLLAGAALLEQSAAGAGASGPLMAATLRYVQPEPRSLRYFGEAGVSLGALGMSFSRHYDDGTLARRAVAGSTLGMLGAAYLRGGVLYAPAPDHEIAFSATLREDVLATGAYSEALSDANLFPASFSGGVGRFTTIEARAAWTTKLSPQFDLTASASLGATRAHDGVAAEVMFVDRVTGAPRDALFAAYGLRLGWQPSPDTTVDAFLAGSSTAGMDPHLQAGAAYRIKF